jgi:hypothetical protein
MPTPRRMLSGEGYEVDTVRWRQRLTSSGNGREGHDEHDVKCSVVAVVVVVVVVNVREAEAVAVNVELTFFTQRVSTRENDDDARGKPGRVEKTTEGQTKGDHPSVWASYWQVYPPSALTRAPVMNAHSSDKRNSTARPISSGVPSR